jgi:hypothetical protein
LADTNALALLARRKLCKQAAVKVAIAQFAIRAEDLPVTNPNRQLGIGYQIEFQLVRL